MNDKETESYIYEFGQQLQDLIFQQMKNVKHLDNDTQICILGNISGIPLRQFLISYCYPMRLRSKSLSECTVLIEEVLNELKINVLKEIAEQGISNE